MSRLTFGLLLVAATIGAVLWHIRAGVRAVERAVFSGGLQ